MSPLTMEPSSCAIPCQPRRGGMVRQDAGCRQHSIRRSTLPMRKKGRSGSHFLLAANTDNSQVGIALTTGRVVVGELDHPSRFVFSTSAASNASCQLSSTVSACIAKRLEVSQPFFSKWFTTTFGKTFPTSQTAETLPLGGRRGRALARAEDLAALPSLWTRRQAASLS